VSSRHHFQLHATLLWTINDFLAYGICRDGMQKGSYHVPLHEGNSLNEVVSRW